jgi:hypothetical protein
MLPADGRRSLIRARFESNLMTPLRDRGRFFNNLAAAWPLVSSRIAERTVGSLLVLAGFSPNLLQARQSIKRSLQDESGGVLIDHGRAFGSTDVRGN